AVDGARVARGHHLIQTLSSADVVLHSLAPAIAIAYPEPLPPTVRRRDFVWEVFAARGIPTLSVNWWTTDDSANSIGQSSIFAAAKGDPLQLDNGAAKRALGTIDRSHPQFVTIYLPALDVIL